MIGTKTFFVDTKGTSNKRMQKNTIRPNHMKTKILQISRGIKAGLALTALICFLYACKKSTTSVASVDCSGTAKSYATDVNPIIQASCATNSGCHGSSSHSGPGELLTYAEVFNARSTIRAAVLSGAMPQNGSLTTAQKTAIICWIDNGATNN
jgi:hypothetical protein